MKIKTNLTFILLLMLVWSCNNRQQEHISPFSDGDLITIERSVLKDKIMGGWAGQVIGCTYGGPTEFLWNGTMIGDHVPIPWDETQMEWWYDNSPGLYDDVYMDLTFVQVFEEHGLDAPAELHALAFAHAEYPLWHANQAARNNILNGIMPPESGHWKNNPHADDIDFQIEADFAGLMSPGMINASSAISDKIGHIMNYGDGWYGGVYVAAMYTQAFVSDDIGFVVREALKAIPERSRFYQTIADVIKWHGMYPDDWKRTWFELQKKWTAEKGCPEGVFRAYNIDASINAAYIVLGLLYGDGDYGKTIDISTRAGYDSDCNPSNAAGILGAMLGYSNIPDYWKQGLDRVEHRNFIYTDMSLLDVYDIGYGHALQMIERNGGRVLDDVVEIRYQVVEPVRFEESFAGLYPVDRISHQWPMKWAGLNEGSLVYTNKFKGSAVVVAGNVEKRQSGLPDHDIEIDIFINGELMETSVMPTDYQRRKLDIYWNYDLPEAEHEIRLVPRDLPPGYQVNIHALIVYSNTDPGPQTYF
ncbi:MAG: ADP-ribosylglycohydrolase family protein [Marinilabiliales bacterium]|nr:MAG: ADP-ribosylglycohydrolase family protein [Marinilabiliales bacterium]